MWSVVGWTIARNVGWTGWFIFGVKVVGTVVSWSTGEIVMDMF